MRLCFMGTPDFAVPALLALHAAGHDIAAVYTQPPRPAGRGHALTPCPVQKQATLLGIPVRHPVSLKRDPQAVQDFIALDLDVAVVAAYGLILPPAMLNAPRQGCLNIHASLLPRWRGAAPIQTAILAGDTETGITIMRMDSGLDTGPMLQRAKVPITPTTTASALHDELAALGARLIVDTLRAPPIPEAQPETGSCYAPKLKRDDGRIDWAQSAAHIDRQIRALNPWPGTFTHFNGEVLKILAAEPASGTGQPGTVLNDRLCIACGDGAMRLLRVQRPGRAAMEADAFLRGTPIEAGSRFT